MRSEQYAKYRPTYPLNFFNYLYSVVPIKQNAWDCGTGNGQVAFELAKVFDRVFATDISQTQIDHALQSDNIDYSVQPAENTNFQYQQFDLIVTAQAVHWFNFEQFYSEVRRTAKENALICIIGYGRIMVSDKIDHIITRFYQDTIGAYWDSERRYVDENYETIPFPFEEIKVPRFVNKMRWSLEHLIGYLNTWSAVKHFIKQNGYNPIDKLTKDIEKYWGQQMTREVRFPLLLKIGRIKKNEDRLINS